MDVERTAKRLSSVPTGEPREFVARTGRAAAERLHEALAGIAPISGVSVGKRDDKSTWKIEFADDATDEQKEAAQAALNAFDLAAPDTVFDSRKAAAETLKEVAKDGKATQAQFLAALKNAIAHDLFGF